MPDLRQRLLWLLESIDRNVGSAHPAQQDNLSDGQIMVLALLAVCRGNLRGVYFLLKEDHAEQARIVFRTLLVDGMRMHYFYRNFDRLETMRIAFDLGSLSEERKLINELIRHTGEDDDTRAAHAFADRQEEELRQAARDLGIEEDDLEREKRIIHSADELFKNSPAPEGYFIFRHSSHTAHTSRIALEMQQEQGEDGIIRLQWAVSMAM